MAIISNEVQFSYIGFLAHGEVAEKVEIAEMAEYIARGEILDEAGEKWLQEIQLGECDSQEEAGKLVFELVKRGDLNFWLWIRLYRITLVESFRENAD